MFARYVALGIGAGLVSALLFASVTAGSAPGVLLSYVAPLPVVIVALGWGHLVGLLAAAIGALALSLIIGSSAGLGLALGAGLPAWLLSYLTLSTLRSAGPAGPAWLPPGHLLLVVVVVASMLVLAGAVAVGGGDHAVYRATLARFAEAFLRLYNNAPREGPVPDVMGVRAAAFINFMTAITPAVMGGVLAAVLTANLWIGARIVSVSGRLPRPWLPSPDTRMPPAALGLLLAGCVLALMPGFAGVAGKAFLGALGLALVLQGFALLHAITLGRTSRGLVLAAAYLLTIIAAGPFLPLMAAAGLADIATPIRRRLSGTSGPTPPRSTS